MGKSKRVSKVPGAFARAYTLTGNVLGKGAYAEVRLGKDNETGESVAVKIIDKTQLSKRDLTKLNKEVVILKALRHKNVVRVYDAFDDVDKFYIVMEYIAGGELFAKIVDEENYFNEDKSREIIHTIAVALKYCKDQGVIHRDIKPENILLTKEEEGGEIKIADFNLAKKLDKEAVEFSVLETMCGTPNYVAPEVISGSPYAYKCDIWSLGVISYLLLSGGYLPFFVDGEPGDRDALLRKVREGKWKFTPEFAWQNVSPLAKDLVIKMLRKDPEARVSYDQLLGHPWFKSNDDAMKEKIDMTKMIQLNERRKLLAAAKVQQAVSFFKEVMEEVEEEETGKLSNQNSGVGGFDATFSGLNGGN